MIILVIVLILAVVGIIVFLNKKSNEPGEIVFRKYKNNYYLNSKLLLKDGLRFNTIKFLEDVRSIQIVENKTSYTVKKTNKNFLIFSTYSNNRKEVHKLHEIFVCNEFLQEIFSPETYSLLLTGKECNCKIKFKDD